MLAGATARAASDEEAPGKSPTIYLHNVSWLIQVDYRFTHWRSHG